MAAKWKYRHEKLYLKWTNLRNRCNNPNFERYNSYGGRGIYVCKEWDESFDAFYEWAMANGYEEGLSIERKDNDEGYCPDNCEFIELSAQYHNKQNTLNLAAFDEVKSVAQWARDSRCSVSYHTLIARLRLGWTVEDAITSPITPKPGPGSLIGKNFRKEG